MAGLKEITRRLASVKNTKKITYAMKLVSAAKLRKAQESVTKSREFSRAISDLLAELLAEQSGAEISHPLLTVRSNVKKIRVLVVGGSRGLCGGYNTNVNRKVDALYKEKSAQGTSVDAVILSKKPAEYFRRVGRRYVASYEELSEDANLWPIEEICQKLEEAFVTGEVDEVYMVYTKFRSAISMTATVEKILPMQAADLQNAASLDAPAVSGVTLFEPNVAAVFSAIVPRLLRVKVRQAALDAKASEHGSRMTAMESATKNAGDLIRKLTLTANRLRQSGITSQLLDILGGANAVE